jgi:phosphate ABC transporter permease protein PstC/phosphate ABC transporter permease subunit PstA
MPDLHANGDTRTDDPQSRANEPGATPEPVEMLDTRGAEPDPVVAEKAPAVFPRAGDDASTPVAAGSTRLGDRVFLALTSGASAFVVIVVVLIAIFLLAQSIPSIVHDHANFLFSTDWDTTPGHLHFGVAALLYTTVLISIIALLIAVPIAIGIALFITQFAPRRVSRPVAYVIDLLAAIPSIIYGVWGIRIFAPELAPVQRWLSHIGLGLFTFKGIGTGTVFDGGIVLAIMILPIITAISRDVFDRTPTANKEAALALGATRWEMIRMAVLPYGRAGVVSGSMLGLGRALGETVAVYLILSKVGVFSPSMFSGGETIASKIANGQAEFGSQPGPFIAAGLVLFLLTFVVNAAARAIVNRSIASDHEPRRLPGSAAVARIGSAPIVLVLGALLLIVSFTVAQWFSGGRWATTFASLHGVVGSTPHSYAVATAYFGWLGWLLLALAVVSAALAFVPSVPRAALRALGWIVGVAGVVVTYWAAHLASGLSAINHVDVGFWLAILGFILVGVGLTAIARQRAVTGTRKLLPIGRKATNMLATLAMWASFVIALIPLVWLLWTVVSKGLHVILNADWWTHTQRNLTNSDPGGGALHAIVGTLEQVALCAVIAIPIGLLVGVYLVEYGRGRLARATTFMVDILTGIPSIVAALFIYALIVTTLGGQPAPWLVSMALLILMVPVVVRSTEEMLKLVPNELREAGLALGVPKWKVILKIVIPTAFNGLITGVLLGIARVAGETAPLLILIGYAPSMNANLFSGPQGTLPGMINFQFFNLNQATGAGAYHLDANGNRVAGAAANYSPDRMWGAALTLILIVLLLNIIARLIGRFNKVAK